ncbi:hypothetical protein C0Q70_16339 [Pomacea canaliculata]|uniref:Uncharacterized protein n=1 Tax=Pomacea canaliculata TaxID=400727 RepID=A0A2T7NPI0_POMCA|nr:hypothetical protein C0Q70_16339 [Pomacea canaliculata]
MVETESSEIEHSEASVEIPAIDDMDSLLRYCFKCALKKSIKKSDLPLLTSTFLKVHMQPFCPAGSILSFAKFLQQMQSEEFIKLKELSKGVDSISEFDRSHPDLRDLVAPDLPALEKEVAEETAYEPPEIIEVFCITTATLPLFKNQGFSKGDSLSLTELRKQITDYVKTNNLQTEADVSQVQLDPVLAEITLLRNEGDRSLLPWNELIIRITDKMQPGCLIKLAGQQPVLRKGKMEPIKLNVVQRGSQKKVTVIENLEFYGIDPRVFAHAVQIAMACSATTVDSEQKNHGVNVVVQGNQMTFISKLLLDKYRIPRKYIQGLETVSKAKKK